MINNKIKIAAVNFKSSQDIFENINHLEEFLDILTKENVHFVLFPELSISSYCNNFSIHRKWDECKGEAIRKLNEISKKYDIIFSVGFPHDSHISQAVWYRGNMQALHHKTKLGPSEKANFKWGRDIHISNIEGFKFGTSICYESHFPEISAKYEEQGASLLCFPFASPRESLEEKDDRFKMILRARAYDNSCFAICCNSIGEYGSNKDKYAGVALIIDPKGKILAETKSYEETYIIAEMDLDIIENIKKSNMGYFRSEDNFRI